jgi:hypothetical protein
MRWVKLTLTTGGETYVNMDLVTELRPRDGGGTQIFFSSDLDHVEVCEACEEIMRCL